MKGLTLKADTALLRALIEADPVFKLEISKAVLKNVSDDAVKIQVHERLNATLAEMAKAQERWDYTMPGQNPWRSNAFHDLLKKLVATHIAQATEELIIESVTPVIQKVFEAQLPEFQKQLDAMIDASLTEDHLRKRLEAKLAALAL